MQCLSRKKDEEFLQFFVLFLLVGILIFILLYRRSPSRCFFRLFKNRCRKDGVTAEKQIVGCDRRL